MSFRTVIELLHQWDRKRQATVTLLEYLCVDGLRAADLESDRTSGHSTVTDEDGLPMPAVTDPTGESVLKPDRARYQLSEIATAEARICAAASELYGPCRTLTVAKQTLWIYLNHQDKPRVRWVESTVEKQTNVLHRISVEHHCERCTKPVPHPCPRHSSLTKSDLEADLGVQKPEHVCGFCFSAPACTANQTTVSGNLASGRWVCRSCYDRIRGTGKPPTRQDLEHLQRVGKWPRQKVSAA